VVEDGFIPYYPSIMPGIKAILQNAGAVKQAATTARVSLSSSSQSHTHTHPNAIQNQHTNANNAIAYMHLCGKAMECVGLIGEAVGSTVFSQDALEIIQLLLNAMDTHTTGGAGPAGPVGSTITNSNDTITFDYILPACARIAKALGECLRPMRVVTY